MQRVGADNLPYVYIGTALVVGLLISSYSRYLVDRLPLRRLIPATYTFFAANLLLFSWLLRHDGLATTAAFYVWTKLYPVLFSDPRARVRGGAIAGGYEDPAPRFSALAERELQRLATESGPEGSEYRREAALLTAILPASEGTRRVLLRLLEDPDESVRKAAVVSAGRGRHRDAVPGVIRALQSPRIRQEARSSLLALGERVLGTIADHLQDRAEARIVRTQLAKVLAELASPRAAAYLLGVVDEPDADLRYHVLKALNRRRRDDPEAVFESAPLDRAIRLDVEQIARLRATRAPSRGPRAPGESLLERVIDEREDDAVERITRALGLMYPLDEMFQAYRAIASGETERRAQGLELLDTVLEPAHRRLVVPLLERVGGVSDSTIGPRPEVLPISDPWLSACFRYVEMRRSEDGPAAMPIEDRTMMTIVERADFLRGVAMFAMVRTEYLAKIAAVAKERDLHPGEELFTQGSPPEAVRQLEPPGFLALNYGHQTLLVFLPIWSLGPSSDRSMRSRSRRERGWKG